MFSTVGQSLNKIQESMLKKCSLQQGSHWTRYKNRFQRNILYSRVVTGQDTKTNDEEMFSTVGQSLDKIQEPMTKKCSLQQGSHWTRYKNQFQRNVLYSRIVTGQDTRTNSKEMFSTVGQSLDKIQEPMMKKCSLQQGSHRTRYKNQFQRNALYSRVVTGQDTRTNSKEMFSTVGQSLDKIQEPIPKKCSLQQDSHRTRYKIQFQRNVLYSRVVTGQDTRTNSKEMFSTVGQSLDKIQAPIPKKCSLQQGSHWTRYKNQFQRNFLYSRVVTGQDTRTNSKEMFSIVGQSLDKIQDPIPQTCPLQQGSH